jgi:hypothetical protein
VAAIDEIRLKIERAKKHIYDLKSEIATFYATDPYVSEIKLDPQTGDSVRYLTRCDDVPLSISIIAGDAISNIRTALDHLAYQLVRVGTGKSGPFKGVYFPITDDASELEAAIERKIKFARKEAKDAVRAIKPYKGGNWPLWHLHRLNNIDKHRLLVAAANTAFRNLGPRDLKMLQDLYRGSHPGQPLPDSLTSLTGSWMAVRGFPLKVGDELVRGISDVELNHQYRVHFQIAFNEPEVIQRQPILETVHGMAKLVGDIITDFGPLL